MTANRLRLIGALALLVLLGLVAWAWLLPGTNDRVAALRQQGYPGSLLELDRWYAPVPDAENAALICTQAFADPFFSQTGGSTSAALDPDLLPPRGQDFNADDKKALAESLKENSDVLKLLHSIPASARSRYPVDLTQGFNALIPHLGQMKKAVSLLGAEAMLHAADGNTEEAVQSLEAAGRAADTLAAEPLLISQLVRMSCWSIVTARLERILNFASLSESQMAALQKVLAAAEEPPALDRALGGELASGLAVFTDRKYQTSVLSATGPGQTSPSQMVQSTAAFTAMRVTGILGRDKGVYVEVMTTNLAAARLPFPDRVKLGQQAATLAATRPNRLCIFSRMLLPALSRCFLTDADCAARLRTARVALAVERFRKTHGAALPATLQELVPAYLNKIVTDPYDGEPLRFKKRDSGYVIYSLGRNEKDDGGKERNSKKPNDPYDITFIVER